MEIKVDKRKYTIGYSRLQKMNRVVEIDEGKVESLSKDIRNLRNETIISKYDFIDEVSESNDPLEKEMEG